MTTKYIAYTEQSLKAFDEEVDMVRYIQEVSAFFDEGKVGRRSLVKRAVKVTTEELDLSKILGGDIYRDKTDSR